MFKSGTQMGMTLEELKGWLSPYTVARQMISGPSPDLYIVAQKADGGLEAETNTSGAQFVLDIFVRATSDGFKTAEETSLAVLDYLSNRMANSGDVGNLDVASFGLAGVSGSTTQIYRAVIVVRTPYIP